MITSKNPDDYVYTDKDYDNYARLMYKTNAIRRGNKPKTFYPKSSKSEKWKKILSPIWADKKKYKEKVYPLQGKGVVVIPSDPNAYVRKTRPIAC